MCPMHLHANKRNNIETIFASGIISTAWEVFQLKLIELIHFFGDSMHHTFAAHTHRPDRMHSAP